MTLYQRRAATRVCPGRSLPRSELRDAGHRVPWHRVTSVLNRSRPAGVRRVLHQVVPLRPAPWCTPAQAQTFKRSRISLPGLK